MKIETFTRFRWEYILDESRAGSTDPFFVPKRWRLFTEEVDVPTEVRTLQEAAEILPAYHPAFPALYDLFCSTRERVEFVPWKPFEPSKELTDALGPHVVELVERDHRTRKVWSSADGWTWLHVEGDSASDLQGVGTEGYRG